MLLANLVQLRLQLYLTFKLAEHPLVHNVRILPEGVGLKKYKRPAPAEELN